MEKDVIKAIIKIIIKTSKKIKKDFVDVEKKENVHIILAEVVTGIFAVIACGGNSEE